MLAFGNLRRDQPVFGLPDNFYVWRVFADKWESYDRCSAGLCRLYVCTKSFLGSNAATAPAMKARRVLAGFMVLIALIQIVDIVDDLFRGASLLVPGLLVFAIVFLLGARRLFGQAIWQVSAWRDLESH